MLSLSIICELPMVSNVLSYFYGFFRVSLFLVCMTGGEDVLTDIFGFSGSSSSGGGGGGSNLGYSSSDIPEVDVEMLQKFSRFFLFFLYFCLFFFYNLFLFYGIFLICCLLRLLFLFRLFILYFAIFLFYTNCFI